MQAYAPPLMHATRGFQATSRSVFWVRTARKGEETASTAHHWFVRCGVLCTCCLVSPNCILIIYVLKFGWPSFLTSVFNDVGSCTSASTDTNANTPIALLPIALNFNLPASFGFPISAVGTVSAPKQLAKEPIPKNCPLPSRVLSMHVNK